MPFRRPPGALGVASRRHFGIIYRMHAQHTAGGALRRAIAAAALAAAFLLPSGASAASGIDEKFLDTLLRMPSETHDVDECNRTLDYVKTYLERRGLHCMTTASVKGRNALYASTTPGLSHDYVFVSHVDVVPAYRQDQYVPRREGDWLYARGACDTKGNVAVICRVLENLVGKASVGAVIVTDEEGGDGCTSGPRLLRDAGVAPRKFLIVGDSAGEEPNQLFVAEKGHVHLTIVAHGKGGHSSQPWALDNPVPKLCEAWCRIQQALPVPADPNERWRDVISPTVLKGGPKGNMIPDEASMELSFRFTRPESVDEMVAFLRKHGGLEVRIPKHFRPVVLNKDGDPYIARLLAAMKAKWPSENIREGRMSAATDATYFVDMGLPTVIFAATGSGAHAVSERISLRSLHEYADMFTDYLAAEAALK